MTLEVKTTAEDLHARIRELGPSMGSEVREATRALYGPLHPLDPPQVIIRDLQYGPHERNRLDLHLPRQAPSEPLPVLLFAHGGGFVGGDKGSPGQPFYDNIGRFAVESGFIGANMTYRLAPEATFPAGGEDVAAAIEFLSRAVGDHSGDPERIVAMGHSAGAAHVATCVATPALRMHAHGLRAAVLSSGIYDPAAMRGEANRAYYGEDTTALAAKASLPGLVRAGVPLLVVAAEFDPPDFQSQAAKLADAYVEENDFLPNFVLGLGHNHFSSPGHYGTLDTALSAQVASFVRAHTS